MLNCVFLVPVSMFHGLVGKASCNAFLNPSGHCDSQEDMRIIVEGFVHGCCPGFCCNSSLSVLLTMIK